MGNPNFPSGFGQPQFDPAMGSGMNPMAMNPQMSMQQHNMNLNAAQRNYQMQLQAQARQLAQAQARQHGGMTGVPNQQMPAGMNPMQVGMVAQQKQKNPEDFIRSLQAFMTARGRAVDLNPTICGRPIQLLQLYAAVVKNGGSQKISKLGQWIHLAAQLQFPPQTQPQAAQEMQHYWMGNSLHQYEAAWQMSQQKQRMAQAAMHGQPNQMSPTRDAHHSQDPSHAQLNHQRNPSEATKLGTPPQNGFLQNGSQTQNQTQHRQSLSRQFDSQLAGASPQKAQPEQAMKIEPEPKMPPRRGISDPFKPDLLPPSRYHGPINVEETFSIGQMVTDLRPYAPSVRELGIIDIHALTRSIKSGIHAETRNALDILVTLSTEPQLQLSLAECDDLMETLVDCAQEQVDFLAEHAPEVSDEMSLTPYEDLVRQCRAEAESLQDIPEFGSVQYDLERAADRLVCITTLVRNFSFYEANFGVLGQAEVLKLVSTVVRYLGTKENILRSSRNTLDFMKDVIIYLSNLSTSVNIPGKEEALCLLHFLLAFAPVPGPVTPSGKICFTSYSPNVHKYMPSAVDSLAKLLARDEPNRTYYKAIFAADAGSTPPFELLTRTFGLAIAAIPSSTRDTKALVEARKPFLLQGMLAAEVLASLAPGSDNPLARSWLESDDGFTASLLRLVFTLSADKSTQLASSQPPPPIPHNSRQPRPPEVDANAYGAITARGLAVLKSLVQKSRVLDANGSVVLPTGIMPRKEKLLGALIEKDIDPGILRMLCVYAGLED
jgi:SWI/SNF chromatin-remodeling complex subunit SWI1